VAADIAFDLALEHGRCVGVRIPTADAALDALAGALSPAERSRAAGMPMPRRRTWVGGRAAMREALDRLGLTPVAIASDDRGAPVLPAGVTGSITHKEGLAAALVALVALVAPASSARVGVDVEHDIVRSQDIASRILTPAELAEMAKEYHAKLVEMVAESDDALMEIFFESGEIPHDKMVAGLHKAFLERKIFPVVLASAIRAIGMRNILDAALELMPAASERGPRAGVVPGTGASAERLPSSGAPASAFVFKTIADPYAGRLSIFRVISGTLRGDTTLQNSGRGVPERLGTVNLLQGKQLVAVPELRAGDLGVVAKLKETRTSDTLADPAHPIQYAPIAFPEPAISFAIEPKSKGDEDKISTALARLMEEDPVLRVNRDPRTHEMLVSGNGQVHVEVAIAKMKRKFGVEAVLRQPKVPYLETIKRRVPAVQGRHKKQTGGRGQFGDCWIELEPLPRGAGFEFVDKIFGGSIPQNFRPAVEKGIRESAERGWLAGNPVVDFRVTLTDGSYHDVDSSEMAFKIAGSLAFKAAMEQARPTILEPIYSVEITAPEEYMGEIMGDLSSRRGKPQGMETQGHFQIIKAIVPLAELLTYASTLKSITSDRGTYHMEFDHYDELPAQVQEKILADYARYKQQEAEK